MRKSNGLKRAFSCIEVLKIKRTTLAFEGEWKAAFGSPEDKGVWFIWGGSGNGKSSFVMQLAKELAKMGKVLIESMEEGMSLSMQNSIRLHGVQEMSGRIQVVDGESLSDLEARMKKQKSPRFVIIDSFQYMQMTYKDYLAFKERHQNKLIIFTSHADGKKPKGKAAVSVMYDASEKIYIEGFRAFSKGRFVGENGGVFDIYPQGSQRYWGSDIQNDNKI